MQAAGALNVEPVDAYAQVVVALDVLLTRIEFLALVDVLAARLAPHVERRHQSHGVLAISRQFHARDLRRIEVRRIVFLKERQEIERLYQNVDKYADTCGKKAIVRPVLTFKTLRSDILRL